MPPSSHSSLFKQRRRQKLRLVLFLFAMIPLIFELKSHYYYYRPFEENGGVPRRHRYQHHHQSDGHMEHQLQQLSSSFELPTFLAGEEEAMKYIERHGKKSGGGGTNRGRTQSTQRRGWIASSSSSSSSSSSGSNSNNNKPDKKFYDVYLKNAIENKPAYPLLKGFLRTVLEQYPESRTWFDGGAGTCGTMRALRSAGKIVRGIEISDVRKTSCKELAKEGVVETGVLNDLSRFEDKQFDVVFSSEVLEHVPTHLAEQSVKELVRIAKKDVFVTISLRRSGLDPKDPKKPAIVHLTVWPREKWEKAFQKAGCDVNRDALKKFDLYDESKYGAKPNFFAFTCHQNDKDDDLEVKVEVEVHEENHGASTSRTEGVDEDAKKRT